MTDFHDVPRFDERWQYLYLEHGELDRSASSVVFHKGELETAVPLEQFATLMLGPGTTITAAAIKVLAKNNCLLCWIGEEGARLYATGIGGTHSSHRLLKQVELYANEKKRMRVVRAMYTKQFKAPVSIHLSLQQLRGKEGSRVRANYQRCAEEYGVPWKSRSYDQGEWDWADPINRALSTANALLHGLCHAAILSAGYSAAIGFIHTGKMLSFVYDVADWYKSDVTVPLAFRLVSEGADEIERRTSRACRQAFFAARLSDRILPDIAEVFNAGDHLEERSGELEGRAVSLADRSGSGGVSGEPLGEDPGQAVG
jgi:CRISPR-associated protein Cas1